jgi:hypothetical protein
MIERGTCPTLASGVQLRTHCGASICAAGTEVRAIYNPVEISGRRV